MDEESTSQPEDWLAGATLEAEKDGIDIPGVCMSFEGVDLPDDDPDLVS